MTIENHFRFGNSIARFGVAQEVPIDGSNLVGGLQFGLALHSIHYWMDQRNHIQLSDRSHEERWVEYKPTWGLSLRFTELEIRYQGSVVNGTGRPGVAPGRFLERDAATAVSSQLLIAPSGPLTLDEVRVSTHQISVSLPVR